MKLLSFSFDWERPRYPRSFVLEEGEVLLFNKMLGFIAKLQLLDLREMLLKLHIRLLTLLIGLVVLPQESVAENIVESSLKCVQNQLKHLEYYSGKIDGIPGPATARAYSKLVATKKYSGLRKRFNRRSTIVACRYLGDTNKELRKFWPSNKTLASIDFDPSLPIQLKKNIADYIPKLARRFSQLGMTSSMNPKIVVFQDKNFGSRTQSKYAITKNKASISSGIEQFQRRYEFQCKFKHASAWMMSGVVYICIVPDNPILTGVSESVQEANGGYWKMVASDVRGLIPHELFHASQLELTGFLGFRKKPKNIPAAIRNERGPEWLYEGSAQALELRYKTSGMSLQFYYANKNKRNAIPAGKLKEIEIFPTERNAKGDAYDRGEHAAYALINKTGLLTIADFYRKIGLGVSWEKAFSEAFGITVDEFYADYTSKH